MPATQATVLPGYTKGGKSKKKGKMSDYLKGAK